MKKLLLLILLATTLHADEPILQATIALTPQSPCPYLQPGMPALLSTTITNTGTATNAPTEVFIRFSLPPALAHLAPGVNFQTEKQPLPSLQPGQHTTITFNTPQPLPPLTDFLKYDWPKHLYQTIIPTTQSELTIGTGTITFSAHYYNGPNKPTPTPVP